MTEALVTLARIYIEDETAPYAVSDAIIEQKLNIDRQYIENLQIVAEDYDYDNESCVYSIGYAYIMNLVLTDGDGDVISDSDYTVDVENGIVVFDSSPPVTIPNVVYATFNYCDFYNAISELWLYQAALSRFSGRPQLGDEVIPIDKNNREYCIQKYWDYKQSKGFTLER